MLQETINTRNAINTQQRVTHTDSAYQLTHVQLMFVQKEVLTQLKLTDKLNNALRSNRGSRCCCCCRWSEPVVVVCSRKPQETKNEEPRVAQSTSSYSLSWLATQPAWPRTSGHWERLAAAAARPNKIYRHALNLVETAKSVTSVHRSRRAECSYRRQMPEFNPVNLYRFRHHRVCPSSTAPSVGIHLASTFQIMSAWNS